MPNRGGWRGNFSPRLPGKRGKCGSGGGCLKLGLGCLPQQRTFQIECANYWTYSLCSCLDQRTFQGVQVLTTGLIPNNIPASSKDSPKWVPTTGLIPNDLTCLNWGLSRGCVYHARIYHGLPLLRAWGLITWPGCHKSQVGLLDTSALPESHLGS